MFIRRFVVLAGIAIALAASLLPSGSAQAQSRICFAEVPDCIEGRFAEYWRQNGGLPVFGFPITPATNQTVGGGTFLVQTFERNRFELHPENARPYDVLLGRLGDDRLRQLGRPWENEPKAASNSQPGCQYFSETQHLVCGPILNYWRSNGLDLDGRRGFTTAESLALFGLPLTEARMETGSDGKQYLTQWFERARFEVHPEIRPDAVLLGLLGRETLGGGTPPPAAGGDPCANIPASVNGAIEPACFRGGERFAAVGVGFRAGERVGFYVTAPDQSVIDLNPSQAPSEADNTGLFGILGTMPNGLPEGIYAITFEGVSSGHKAIVYFKVLPRQAPNPGSLPPIPASQNAVAEPQSGPQGTRFAFIGSGFRGGERVGVYITAPDQSVLGAPFQVGTSREGVTEVVTYSSDSSDPPGIYAVTFEGVESGRKAIAYFRIEP